MAIKIEVSVNPKTSCSSVTGIWVLSSDIKSFSLDFEPKHMKLRRCNFHETIFAKLLNCNLELLGCF